ncbi:MAG: menaquinone biosynthesis protein [Planctomycetes bacterium]|nr:menaquinone biosynthesis protein [Planctomycetota bacterium]MBI3835916.1 menaquinone biosynthesis protein [Planctomycetota bacterium]
MQTLSDQPNSVLRLGVVSYLNAKPLIEGLDRDPSLTLRFEVPSRLAPLLDANEVDVALVPIIEFFQPPRHWQIVSDACIACDGETLTVRVFSRVPPKDIRRLHVDCDSRTSIALATVLWRELYGTQLELIPYANDPETPNCEAVLLIGDKVVNNTLIDFDIETDLGSAWKTLTGLPFVFAAWAAPMDSELGDLAHNLSSARDAGVASAELLAADYGPGLKWPVAQAKRYLTKRLKFTIGPRYHEGMQLFLELTKRHGLVQVDRELCFA